MVKIANKILTLEEFIQQPETEPASEYIDGQVSQKPMPKGKHSLIQSEMLNTVNSIAKPRKIAYAFPELRCTFAGISLVPDVVILEWSKIPLDADGEIQNIIITAPDWTVEILSPMQNPTKIIKKILHCLNHGTRLGWLIDPEERTILVFSAGQQPRAFEEEGDRLPVLDSIEGLELNLGQVFGWLKL
jgi:Uma2 family endonuclease